MLFGTGPDTGLNPPMTPLDYKGFSTLPSNFHIVMEIEL